MAGIGLITARKDLSCAVSSSLTVSPFGRRFITADVVPGVLIWFFVLTNGEHRPWRCAIYAPATHIHALNRMGCHTAGVLSNGMAVACHDRTSPGSLEMQITVLNAGSMALLVLLLQGPAPAIVPVIQEPAAGSTQAALHPQAKSPRLPHSTTTMPHVRHRLALPTVQPNIEGYRTPKDCTRKPMLTVRGWVRSQTSMPQ